MTCGKAESVKGRHRKGGGCAAPRGLSTAAIATGSADCGTGQYGSVQKALVNVTSTLRGAPMNTRPEA